MTRQSSRGFARFGKPAQRLRGVRFLVVFFAGRFFAAFFFAAFFFAG